MTEEERRKWLDGLKVGDEVAVQTWPGNREYPSSTEIRPIRFCDESEIVIGTQMYRREDGRHINGSYHRIACAGEPERETADRESIAKAFTYPRDVSKELPITTVRQILELLKQAKEEK